MISRMMGLAVVTLLVSSTFADVEVLEFTNKIEWEDAVGSFETIGFTGNEHGDYIGDDFLESHGVTFSNAYYWNTISFVNDDWGFTNNNFVGGTWITFDDPMYWFAADHPGFRAFQLFNNGNLIYDSNIFGASGTGNFRGFLSTRPFDQVYVHSPKPFHPNSSIDDIHFGTIIPTPGALGVMVIGYILSRRRRRSKK